MTLLRERLLMDFGWRFHRGDLPTTPTWVRAREFTEGPPGAEFDDSGWPLVDLPHDFVLEGDFDRDVDPRHGFLAGEVAWYRRTFPVPAEDLGRRIYLEFDGVYRDSTVYLNGFRVGRHASGYTSFRFDVTEMISYGGDNVLAVRVDSREYEGWWYEGGGIYRHVWLLKTAPIHLAPGGVHVSCEVEESTEPSEAVVHIDHTVRSRELEAREISVVTRTVAPDGSTVSGSRVDVTASAFDDAATSQRLTIERPAVWSVDAPNLYTLVSTVNVDGEAVDEVQTTFGVRSLRFDADEGFLLNGQPLKLKGVCCHQDHAGVGIAVPEAVHEHRLRALKDMGCNAYRCAHNPPTPEFLDLCDRLGMLVLDETRLLSTAPECLRQLSDMIVRDRNHPCVIAWSLGNEESHLQGNDFGLRIAETMKQIARRLDSTRPVTVPMNGEWGSGTSQVVDLQGCNYFACGDIDGFRADFPTTPILLTESGSTVSTRGIYEADHERGYIPAYDGAEPRVGWESGAEDHWRRVAEHDWIAGTFVWTGFDYRGEPDPFEWPCISSHYGLMDLCGFPKDNYHYYRAWWSDRPYLHLFPHWNWPGREGEEIRVVCYANCEEVELLLNGERLGAERMQPNGHVEWQVAYEPGTLEARGWSSGEQVLSQTVLTTGPAHALRLVPNRQTLKADRQDVAVVRVEVVDQQGIIVPTADNEISFRLSEGATVLGVGNGDPSSHEPDKATRRRAFNGLNMALVQAGEASGASALTAASPGLLGASTTIDLLACERRPFVP